MNYLIEQPLQAQRCFPDVSYKHFMDHASRAKTPVVKKKLIKNGQPINEPPVFINC
jgi:hypothetical protein